MRGIKNRGLCWHVHHNRLIECCYDFTERVNAIKVNKPANEVEARLRLFKFIKGKLPAAVSDTAKVFAKADIVYRKASNGYWDGPAKSMKEADKTLRRASDVWDSANANLKAAINDNMPAIEELHRKECCNCPWNGKEIVFEED